MKSHALFMLLAISIAVSKSHSSLGSYTIAAGHRHTLLLDNDGHVWSFGDNDFGQLGHIDLKNQAVPQKIAAINDIKIIAFAAGKCHSVLIDSEG